jgi:hypothetical protein
MVGKNEGGRYLEAKFLHVRELGVSISTLLYLFFRANCEAEFCSVLSTYSGGILLERALVFLVGVLSCTRIRPFDN